jgi:hypothetical protein
MSDMADSQQVKLEEAKPWVRGIATVSWSLIGALGVAQALNGHWLGWVLFVFGQLLVFLTARSFPVPASGKAQVYRRALAIVGVLMALQLGLFYFFAL